MTRAVVKLEEIFAYVELYAVFSHLYRSNCFVLIDVCKAQVKEVINLTYALEVIGHVVSNRQ